jgi:hypothetical protein
VATVDEAATGAATATCADQPEAPSAETGTTVAAIASRINLTRWYGRIVLLLS